MKSKRYLSFLMALIISFSGCVLVYAQNDADVPSESAETTVTNSEPQTETQEEENPFDGFVIDNISDYKKMLAKFNRPTVTTEQFFKFVRILNFPYRLLTGSAFMPEEHFNVTLDAFIESLSEEVLAESGLDAAAIFKNFPDINGPAELVVKTLNIDTTEFRNQMYAKRDELWAANDDTTATLYHFLGAYLSIIEKCELYAEPTNDPDVYEIKARYTYKDGETEELRPGFYVNTVTGECTNKNNSGVMGSGFNFSITEISLVVLNFLKTFSKDTSSIFLKTSAASISS